MKKLSEINGNYPNLDSTNVLQEQDMNKVLGGDDCKSCGSGCKNGCVDGNRQGTSTGHLTQDLVTQVQVQV